MTDSNALGHEDEAPTDELLADLERLAETRNSSRRTGSQDAPSISDSAASSEHQRLYMFVDELASPIRAALVADEAPPILPEYGELEEVGRGGMGIVYRSTHQKMQRVDAIKVIRPDRLTGVSFDAVKQMQNRFEREVRLAAYVAHEHIVPVYQVGEIDGCPWFSMQFVIGTTLNELSKPDVSNTSQVPSPLEVLKSEVPVPERMAGYIEKIARAVDAVHRHGILHGDIKPHNILIETETDRPLLSDFGLAEFDACDASMTSTGVAGTLAYMAPELAQAAKRNASPDEIAANRSVSSDVYSLGATLWAALTGRSPREADGFPSTLPVELLRICQKSMAEDPSSRHASAKEFADDLATWLNRPRWNRFFPGLRHLLWMVVAPLLFANGAVVWFLLRLRASEPWVWLAIFVGYAPLFATFGASQQFNRASESARRGLWSIWIGHAVGSLACLTSLSIMFHADPYRAIAVFYPCWAVISSVALFAKSGNFWTAYRWIGVAWSVIAVLLAAIPTVSPIAFGFFAALTCIIIARGDREFWNA
ncbi:MAG: serine/threonine-protein kinase [Fuerstiella sp.]